MKFSILISSFNKGKYLGKCLNSCLNQKENDYEIIVFDNYSTDNTSKILNKFKKFPRIKIFKKKKISKSPALNQIDLIKNAFVKSKGKIICLLDADDYFNPNKLSVLKKNFDQKNHINTIFDLPIKKYGSFKKKFKDKKKNTKKYLAYNNSYEWYKF